MYEARIGRFLSEDPVGLDSDNDLYRYVENNPVNAVDPSGMAKIICPYKNRLYSDNKMTVVTDCKGDGDACCVAARPGSKHSTRIGIIYDWEYQFGSYRLVDAQLDYDQLTNLIVRPGEDWRIFYIFASQGADGKYVVRFTGADGTPTVAQVLKSGITPTGPDVCLHPIEHCLNQHNRGPTPYTSASTLPKGATKILGQPVWIDVNRLKGNTVYTYKDLVRMSSDFLQRNEHLRVRFDSWKQAQKLEGEVLIEGKIPAAAITTKTGMLCRSAAGAGGQVLFYGAIAMDTYAFFAAEDKARETARITGGWSGAYVGARVGAAGGARVGVVVAATIGVAGPQAATPEEIVTVPVGAAVGGLIGGIGGSIVGYQAGSQAVTNYYDFIVEQKRRSAP